MSIQQMVCYYNLNGWNLEKIVGGRRLYSTLKLRFSMGKGRIGM